MMMVITITITITITINDNDHDHHLPAAFQTVHCIHGHGQAQRWRCNDWSPYNGECRTAQWRRDATIVQLCWFGAVLAHLAINSWLRKSRIGLLSIAHIYIFRTSMYCTYLHLTSIYCTSNKLWQKWGYLISVINFLINIKAIFRAGCIYTICFLEAM